MLEEHEKEEGLTIRYEVTRLGDEAGKHDECRYFVLDPKHDPIARIALRAYAQEAAVRGYQPLANDLFDWITKETLGGRNA